MYTKDSKPYLYPFLSRIVAPVGSTGLQYDVYPMTVELNQRFFMNLVHGDNVVAENSISLGDLPFIKALVEGTIDAALVYELADGTAKSGAEIISALDSTFAEIRAAFENTIDIFETMTENKPARLKIATEKTPEQALGVDIHAIAERLSSRSGRIRETP